MRDALLAAQARKHAVAHGQIFGVQGNDISVFSQPRTVDFREKESGWTPESIISECLPALTPSYTPLDRGMGQITRPPEKVTA